MDEEAEDLLSEVDTSLALSVKRGGVWGTLVNTPIQDKVDVKEELLGLTGRYVIIEKPGNFVLRMFTFGFASLSQNWKKLGQHPDPFIIFSNNHR